MSEQAVSERSRLGPVARARGYAAAIIDVRILGPLEVATANRLRTITGPRERVVLAALAMSSGRVVNTDRLSDAVWGDSPPASCVKVVQNLILKLRTALGPGAIETRAGGYVLVGETVGTDAGQFERGADVGRVLARSGDVAAAVPAFVDALRLWRDHPLPELRDWAPGVAEASRLEELRRSVQEDRFEAELACGRHHEAVVDLEAMVVDEPLRERRWALLALALYRDGRQADALRALHRASGALGEIGLDPGPDLQALERSIAAQDPSLDGPRPAPSDRPARGDSMGEPLRQLPAALTRFIGRAEQIAAISELLAGSRVVTLTGAGGAGKTRLALEVAAGVDDASDGMWFVELMAVVDESGVSTVVAAALGIREMSVDAGGDALSPVVEFLAPRRALLVFDNCEHVVEAAARAAYALLRGCAHLRVLATSREPLGLPGEAVYVVPSMGVPPAEAASGDEIVRSDAGALFCDRARSANPHFQLRHDEAAAVASICRTLDGIPLAIELAAAWVRVVTVGEIASRLDDCLDLLRGGPRTAMAHHQTMRATLDWSYGLLTAPEQGALRWLGAFPDDFDLDAAVELLAPIVDRSGGQSPGLELVAHLVDKSLVVANQTRGQVRYRLLVPVAQYARARLAETDETDIATGHHDRVFITRAEAHHRFSPVFSQPTGQPSYHAALERAWRAGDSRSAKLLALVQGGGWNWTGDPRGIQWMERLASAKPDDPALDAWILTWLASLLHHSAQPAVARQRHLLEQAVVVGEGTAAERGALFVLGELELTYGDTNRARALFLGLRDVHERDGSWDSAGVCDDHLGWTSVIDGAFDDAVRSFTRALDLARRAGNEWLADHALAALAPLQVRAGAVDDGLRAADEAIAVARRLDPEGLLPMALTRAAEAAVLARERERGGRFLTEVATGLRWSPSRRWLADTLETGAVLAEGHAPELSASLLGAADTVRAATDEHLGGQRVITAQVRLARERLAEALTPHDFDRAWKLGGRRSTADSLDELLAWLARSAPPAQPN